MTQTKIKVRTEYHPVVLHTHPALDMDEEQFFEFCQQNKDVRIERTAEGDLEVMPPTGGETGNRNIKLTAQLEAWAEHDVTGAAFDSSTGFVLPNGAVRAPDAAWVHRRPATDLGAPSVVRTVAFLPVVIRRTTTARNLVYILIRI